MYDYDNMKCHAYDCHTNACVTPECYKRVVRLLGIALFSNITNPTVYSSTGVGRRDELEIIENKRTSTTSDRTT
jgi:hypothetical protein